MHYAMKKITVAALLALTVAGCSSTGTMVSQEQAQQFTVGKTTLEDVVAKLGAPNSRSITPNGITTITYIHTATHINAATFVPYVGLLAGGASANSNTATMTFDANHLLMGTGITDSNSKINTGLLNQH